MPNWKKVIVSGSNASLNQVSASGGINAVLPSSGQPNFVAYDSASGAFSYASTSSYVPYGNLGNDLTQFRAPLAQIQEYAGVKYHFPANAKELQPGKEWPVDYGALTNAKRAKCGKNTE